MSNLISCKDLSSSAGEHLFGTAPRTDHWFLLEYPYNWEKDILNNIKVPQNVKDELNRLLGSFPRSRLQLIKKNGPQSSKICFYYVNSTEFDPKVYKFTLDSFEEIISLNLTDLTKNEDIRNSETDEKLALICTHGTYDRCCGTYGVPVYNEIYSSEHLNVWQTTHVGAHRFSANLVMLPEGIYYGRVDPGNVESITRAHINGEIYLDCFRGRCCYGQISQVSDYFLRKEIKKYGIYDLEWEFEKDMDAYTATEFKLRDEDIGYSVNSVVLNNAIVIKPSCSSDKTEAVPQFYFYSIIPYTPRKEQKDESG